MKVSLFHQCNQGIKNCIYVITNTFRYGWYVEKKIRCQGIAMKRKLVFAAFFLFINSTVPIACKGRETLIEQVTFSEGLDATQGSESDPSQTEILPADPAPVPDPAMPQNLPTKEPMQPEVVAPKNIPSLASMGYRVGVRGIPRPASFMADMAKGIKVPAIDQNCPYANVPDIYFFTDGVVYTTDTLPDEGYNSNTLYETWAHGCKMPIINGLTITFPANDPKPPLYSVAKPATLPNLNYNFPLNSRVRQDSVNFNADMLRGYMIDFRKLPSNCSYRWDPLIYVFNNVVITAIYGATDFWFMSRAEFNAGGCPVSLN